MSGREELHKLVDGIPEAEIDAARMALRSLVDPVELSLLTAPPDDEPETDEERQAVERALNDPRPDIPIEEVLREYGL
jgi:hypothetical protein